MRVFVHIFSAIQVFFFFLFIFVKVFVRYMFIYNTVEARCIPNMRAPQIVFSGGMHMIDRC